MIEVRPAWLADAAAIAAIAREVHEMHATAHPELFQPSLDDAATVEEMERLARAPGRVLLVAVEDDAVIGYAQAEVQEAPATRYKKAGALLHLHAMAVAGARRGRGAGRALLAAVRAAAAARGLAGVSLEVYAFNEPARRFYEREGFVPLRALLVTPAPDGPAPDGSTPSS